MVKKIFRGFLKKFSRRTHEENDFNLEEPVVVKKNGRAEILKKENENLTKILIQNKVKVTYLKTKIEEVKVEEKGKFTKLEFYLQNGRVFQKRFLKHSLELQEWLDKKTGDAVTLWVYPDGIIRNIS